MSPSQATSFEFRTAPTRRFDRTDFTQVEVRSASPRPRFEPRARAVSSTQRLRRAEPVTPVKVETYEPVQISAVAKSKRGYHLRKKTRRLVRVSALSLLLVAFSMAGYSYHTQVKAQSTEPTSHFKSQRGDSVAPVNPGLSAVKPTSDEITSHTMPATHPKLLEIADLGLKARIYAVGSTAEGNVAAPKNIYNVGWFEGSSLPGEAGVTFIDGHYGLGVIGGVFKHLAQLKTGQNISLKTGNDTLYNYRISSVQTVAVSAVDMRGVFNPSSKDRKELVLMTCAGKQIPGTTQMDERTIVRAVLL